MSYFQVMYAISMFRVVTLVTDTEEVVLQKTLTNETAALKQGVVKSLAWMTGLKYFGQLISWGITIIVIRLLNPVDYGLMAVCYTITGFMSMLSELKLAAAIVQRRNLLKQQLSQIFGFFILTNIFMLFLLYVLSPSIASFFSQTRLIVILRVSSLTFLPISMYVIPQAILVKEMKFRTKSIVDLIGALASAGLCLTMALNGFGIWSLVVSEIMLHLVLAVGYNFALRLWLWPSFNFSNFGSIFSFGAYLTARGVLWYTHCKADLFIASRVLSSQLVGNYSVAMNLASMPFDKIVPIVSEVGFPAYSLIQKDMDIVAKKFLKTIRLMSVLVFPLYLGILSVVPEGIPLLLGEKWRGVILPLQIICAIMPFRMLASLIDPALVGIGKAKTIFVNGSFLAGVMIFAFLIGVRWGVTGLCVSWVIGYGVTFIIIVVRSMPILKVRVYQFFGALIKPLIGGLLMAGSLWFLRQNFIVGSSSWIELGGLIIAGILIYLIVMYVISSEIFYEAKDLIKREKSVSGKPFG